MNNDISVDPLERALVAGKELKHSLKKMNDRQRAGQIFKRLKAHMIVDDDLNEREIYLLYRYYPFLFK
ncbi:MAG: hypothetical protein SYNGOMJ08_00578 [Candidatus Syntrophoarchaeum sp. GoM_oil]|nr:MAG: hypothetical protein SYNGOMJ08_00578 [Candidatus Syntrophoarchaeum sp. GoM_oil]